VNYSRTWANQVLTYLDASDDNSQIVEVQNRLIKRHLAYINALRIQLRSTTIFDRKNVTYVPSFKLPTDRDSTEELLHFLSSEEYDLIMSKVNPATHLNRLQGEELAQLHKDKIINDFQQVNMMDTLKEFYNLQGMAERIKATPFPRQFAYFSNLFIWIFILLLPFGLVEEFVNIQDGNIVYLTIPISALVSWVFYSMESIGDNSEDPFENYINDVPMTAICNTIERDLLQMIDEPIPDKVSPVNDILM
jgi:putative membrane protein